jgi:hypothetical protein
LKISKMKILEKHEIEKGVRNWRRNSDTSWVKRVKNLGLFVSVWWTQRYLFWKQLTASHLWPLRLTKNNYFLIILLLLLLLLLCFFFFICFSICTMTCHNHKG